MIFSKLEFVSSGSMISLCGFTGPELPCMELMGMENEFITDAQIESSSNYGTRLPQYSRLLSKINAWRPSKDNTDQWISVNLYRQTQVVGVVLQGAYDKSWWVKTYKVAYSLDNKDNHFEFVKDEFGNPEVCIDLYVFVFQYSFIHIQIH